jgi:hypothetical protein
VALTHLCLFSPTEREIAVLMAIKDGTDELANTIKTDIEVLLQHIAYGEQVQAEQMIVVAPHLLMMSGDVVDYSNRKIIHVTPAQLAFGGDDEEMCAMLKAQLGDVEFAKQISEKFPENAITEQNAADEFATFMNQLVDAITDPNANILNEINHVGNESPLRNLLDSFRIKFTPGEVRTGKHFNVRLLLEALEVYEANYDEWDEDRCHLFWSQVVGYLQRLLPVSYVQAGCQVIDHVIKGERLNRLLKLVGESTYFPLDADPANRLGFDHGVYFGPGGGWVLATGHGPRGAVDSCDFSNLLSSKNIRLVEILQPQREGQRLRYVV